MVEEKVEAFILAIRCIRILGRWIGLETDGIKPTPRTADPPAQARSEYRPRIPYSRATTVS